MDQQMTLLGNKYFDSLVIIITVYFGFSVFNWQDFSRSVSKVHNDLSKYSLQARNKTVEAEL